MAKNKKEALIDLVSQRALSAYKKKFGGIKPPEFVELKQNKDGVVTIRLLSERKNLLAAYRVIYQANGMRLELVESATKSKPKRFK
jgi:hypothetical protein